MEWKLSELSVDGKGHYGIGAPAIPYDKNKPTYLRITDINDDGTINFLDLKSVDDEDSNKYQLKENDIVFARTGNSTGRSYFYQKEHGDFVYAGFLIKFSIDPQKVNPKILKYYTHSQEYYNWVKSFDTGGTRGNINAKTFGDMPISLPKRCVQDKIVGILSALDSKIENNNKINANLEAQAQALFKSWFVDFTPFKDQPFVDSELGPIPQGWKVGKLGDYCECVLGGTPSRKEPSYWNGDIAWINSGEVNRFRICTPSEFITSKGLNNSATKMLPAKTTVLAITGATLGQTSILEIDSCANQSVVGIKQNDNMPYEFIYPTIKVNIKRLINLQTGGAQQHINKENIKNLFIVYPPKFIMQEYKEYTKYIYCNISTLCFENQRLAALRDTLLPKLMSGEIKL